MKKASDVFATIREQKANPTIYADIEKRPTVLSPAGPVVRKEQHAEDGRFKPVKPHNVQSVAGASPRPTSDSANVKLKEETMELNEGKMGQIHADIGEKLDKHIDDYKAHGGAEHLGAKTVKTAGHVAKLHGIEQKHAQKFVNDYVETRLKEEVVVEGMELAIETKKMTTQEKLDKNLKKGGYDSSATQDKLKKIDAALKAQREKYIAQGTLKEEYWKKKGWQKKMSVAAKKQNSKKDDLPFTPDEPTKKSAVAGKYGSGYSTARHLARMAARKAAGLKEGLDMCPICGQTPCNCTHITEAWDQPDYSQSIKARQAEADKKSRKASIIRKAHETAKTKKKTVKESPKDKFEADPELSTQINRND